MQALHGDVPALRGGVREVRGLIPSPIRGPAGNVEMLLWLLNRPAGPTDALDAEARVSAALAQAPAR